MTQVLEGAYKDGQDREHVLLDVQVKMNLLNSSASPVTAQG